MSGGFKMTMIPAGLEHMERKLNERIKAVQGATLQGMLEGANIIIARAQKNSPVLTGNMKASADVIWQSANKPAPAWQGENGKPLSPAQQQALALGWEQFNIQCHDEIKKVPNGTPVVCFGYGAYYAMFVHELHKTQGKFLQRAIVSELERVISRIEIRAKQAGGVP